MTDNRISGIKFGDLPATYLRCRLCGAQADELCIHEFKNGRKVAGHLGSHKERRIDVGKLESEASARKPKRKPKNRKSRASSSQPVSPSSKARKAK